jgi:Rrf2 family protein
MKFSAQEEYGLRCLLAIARSSCGSATIPEISRQESLSESHVAKLLMILRKEGFVDSTRGHSGGYSLSKPAEQLMVGDVLSALGGRLYDDEYCGKHGGLADECVHGTGCALSNLWNSVQEAVDNVIYRVSLKNLIDSDGAQQTVRLRPAMPESIRKRMSTRIGV